MLAIVVWSVGPIVLGVLTSISTQRDVPSVPSHWLPHDATTQAYHELLQGTSSRAAGGTVTEAGTFTPLDVEQRRSSRCSRRRSR